MRLPQTIRFIPLMLVLLALGAVYYWRLDHYFTFEMLASHHAMLKQQVSMHYGFTVAVYSLAYILCVMLSIPGALFLTLAGGYLFGQYWGTLFVIISATLGASCIFLIVRFSLGAWLAQKADKWVIHMQQGFRRNALSYLLFLRLLPIFPYWAINIVAALLNIRLSTFMLGTFFGIIPGTFIYAYLGSGLNEVFERDMTPNLSVIFEPQFIIPLGLLAIMALSPVFIRKLKR